MSCPCLGVCTHAIQIRMRLPYLSPPHDLSFPFSFGACCSALVTFASAATSANVLNIAIQRERKGEEERTKEVGESEIRGHASQVSLPSVSHTQKDKLLGKIMKK